MSPPMAVMAAMAAAALVAFPSTTHAFIGGDNGRAATFVSPRTQQQQQPRSAAGAKPSTSLAASVDPSSISEALSSASIYLSTVSSDIDSIATDQFGLVFAGGIAVMFGGVLSALIVGAILEKGDSYANVIADSYAQGGDEAFWESLTPEQREETQKLLDRVRESKGQGKKEDSVSEAKEMTATDEKKDIKEEKKKQEVSMFSDYED